MNKYDDLSKIKELLDSGVLTQDEFEQQKREIIARSSYTTGATAPNDAKSGWFAVLGFFFPVVGLILWLAWRKQYPLKASSCGKGALYGVGVRVGLWIFAEFRALYGLYR